MQERKTRLARCEFPSEEFALHFEESLPAQVAEIERTVSVIMSLVSEAGCAEGKEFEVELALREALANAILHGCQEDPSKQVGVSVGCAEQKGILIVVRDPGEGFDPSKLDSPVVAQNVFSNHGRGIFLINQLMDEVHFEKDGTEIYMIKRVKKP